MTIKGYYNGTSYMGYVNGYYKEFESYEAYLEYVRELEA